MPNTGLRKLIHDEALIGDVAKMRHRWWDMLRRAEFGSINIDPHPRPETLLQEWENAALFLSLESTAFLSNVDLLRWGWALLPSEEDRKAACGGFLIAAADLAVHAKTYEAADSLVRHSLWAYSWQIAERSGTPLECVSEICWQVLTFRSRGMRLNPLPPVGLVKEGGLEAQIDHFSELHVFWPMLRRVLSKYDADPSRITLWHLE